ncbi:MAG TPA: hypothetical protein VGG72_22550 [Bryobacteraceae bacterium]|jgi:hypothetical protein
MTDEYRDPDLESIRAEWQPPPPSAEFQARMLSAYEREFGRVPWWRRRWPVTAAVAAAAVVLIAMLISRPSGAARYQPVSQPHFVILSAGEHP